MFAPITDLFSPVMELVTGPSRSSSSSIPKLKIYPMFGPLTTCFFSNTHAPFTIVLNEFDRDRYGTSNNVNRPGIFYLPQGGQTGTYNPYIISSNPILSGNNAGRKRKKRQLQSGNLKFQ